MSANDSTTPKTNNTTPKTKDSTTPKTKDSTTPKSKRQYKPREFLSYDETWGKMSKKNLERDRDNDDNDWLNPGQREEMLDQM
ncbi:hypothetical protein C2G38_2233882 [Gigaspora rosea]|uniref:Uncharacterized protein n=1 Tax=Gigaspora rosea TaxID=44941 RepID=A0A397TQU4_9GLOM|nr:hypothetical protein C2G38_2233882 [Gigaspora rosea]